MSGDSAERVTWVNFRLCTYDTTVTSVSKYWCDGTTLVGQSA